MPEFVTRIPAEDLKQCDNWLLPEVTSNNIVSTIKEKSRKIRRSIKEKKLHDKIEKEKQEKQKEIVEKSKKNEIVEEIIDEIIDDPLIIEPMTAENLKKITEEAEKEGYAAGYEQGFTKAKEDGYQQGLEKGEKESRDIVTKQAADLAGIADQLMSSFNSEKDQLEEQMLGMICNIARAVVEKELQLDSSSIVNVVKESIAMLADKNQKMVVYLNSQDVELVKSALDNEDYAIKYEVDDSLLPGGCRIDNRSTYIDASINKKLNDIIYKFLGKQYDYQTEEKIQETASKQDENKIVEEKNIEENIENIIHKEKTSISSESESILEQEKIVDDKNNQGDLAE